MKKELVTSVKAELKSKLVSSVKTEIKRGLHKEMVAVVDKVKVVEKHVLKHDGEIKELHQKLDAEITKNQSQKYLRYKQNRRMRNIIFYNIPEETGEDFHKMESKIVDLLKNQL